MLGYSFGSHSDSHLVRHHPKNQRWRGSASRLRASVDEARASLGRCRRNTAHISAIAASTISSARRRVGSQVAEPELNETLAGRQGGLGTQRTDTGPSVLSGTGLPPAIGGSSVAEIDGLVVGVELQSDRSLFFRSEARFLGPPERQLVLHSSARQVHRDQPSLDLVHVLEDA